MKKVNYLDVMYSFNDGTYRPYQKPDNIMLQYIHVESNHHPNIMKQITKIIQKIPSQLSSNEESFDEAKLQKSVYQKKLK